MIYQKTIMKQKYRKECIRCIHYIQRITSIGKVIDLSENDLMDIDCKLKNCNFRIPKNSEIA